MPPKEADKYSTRSQGRAAGINLSWSRQLGEDIIVTAGQEEPVDSAVQSRPTEQLVNASQTEESEEEIDSIEESNIGNLEWDHTGDVKTPPKDVSSLLDFEQINFDFEVESPDESEASTEGSTCETYPLRDGLEETGCMGLVIPHWNP